MTKREIVGFIYHYLMHNSLYLWFLEIDIDERIRDYIGVCQHGCSQCALYKCRMRDEEFKKIKDMR